MTINIKNPGSKARALRNAMLRRLRLHIPQKVATRPIYSGVTVTQGSSSTLARLWPTAWGNAGAPTAGPTAYFAWAGARPTEQKNGMVPVDNHISTATAGTYTAKGQQRAIFRHTGSALELRFIGGGGLFYVKVDDQYVQATPYNVSDGAVLKLDFGSMGSRRIDIIMDNTARFVGAHGAATDTVAPAPIRGPKVMIFGDSFSSPLGYALWLSDVFGWDDISTSNIGGTSYSVTNSSLSFSQRASSDIVPFAPDILFVLGGTNAFSATPATEAAAATSFWQAVAASLPDTILLSAINAQHGWSHSSMTANAIAVMKATRSAIKAAGVIFCDLLEMPEPYPSLYVSGSVGLAASVGGTSIFVNGIRPRPYDVLEINPGGANCERVVIASDAVNTHPIIGALKYAHSVGETVQQVGPSWLVGSGVIGATTGVGNCDVLIDNTNHPVVPDGTRALGYTLADMIYRQVWERDTPLA
ncbi:SGNH/GDSL hydrolase family protein [Jiella avicenniae]|uniref:SGNH/GDSL hydrolase family protein n=1 Tax=Jiella avicenniae TaxID=2907202 RepID=A0A9X1NZG8_9HYPH|nr:SGNH/GDSL hydrolase family protein [Jiella avicenniae]MCE7028492.1 SGNH/GDSL hydrolase family protein [Jiella avicenniae]